MKNSYKTSKRIWIRVSVLSPCIAGMMTFASRDVIAQEVDPPAIQQKLTEVVGNPPDAPRATPTTRIVMKQYLEDLKQRTPRIPLPELTQEEKKRALEDERAFGYEGRLRKLYLPENAMGNYMPFSGSSNSGNPQSNSRSGQADPLLSLDYGFKVRLFWIAARANNCQYCLGHQESKLLGVGMSEDEIAALDCAWELFSEDEQAAFALARRLTLEPHLICDDDINRCRKYYKDEQILEMIGSIAGNNAINRWKEGAGVPQSSNGGGFGSRDRNANQNGATSGHQSYLTKTSDSFANRRSKVIAIDPEDSSLLQLSPTRLKRPPLETGAELQAKLNAVASRTPRLPLVDEKVSQQVMGELVAGKNVQQWHRLLANFPVAGKRFAIGLQTGSESDELSPALQSKMDWVIARQDRAWYAAELAHEALLESGLTSEGLDALDSDLKIASAQLDERDRVLLLVAKNLCASPIVLTDKEVQDAVAVAGPRAVTQAINYTAYRAAFDRITEAAGLAK